MIGNTGFEVNDTPIGTLSADALSPFSEDGVFTKSFDVTLTGIKGLDETWILSSIARMFKHKSLVFNNRFSEIICLYKNN